MGFGWQGEFVRLVPPDKEKHLDNVMQWANDPGVTENLQAGDLPMTRISLEQSFQREPSKNDVTFAIELHNGEHIGTCAINRINWKDGSATTGTMIGAREYWGKGYGTDAANVRTRYCFEVLGLRYLVSSVLSCNERSLRMLLKAGYVECGRYPNSTWNRGRFVDQILLYLTRKMWQRGSVER